MEITLKSCCALCFFYKQDICPLYKVYNTASDYGKGTFDGRAKYQVCCNKFSLNQLFTNITIDKTQDAFIEIEDFKRYMKN